MQVLLSRPASRLAAGGAGGVAQSDKGAARCAARTARAAAGAERTARPQKPPQRLRGGDIRRLALSKALGEWDKTGILLRKPATEKNNIIIVCGIGGTTTSPLCVPCSEIFGRHENWLCEPQNPTQKHGTGFSERKACSEIFQRILR